MAENFLERCRTYREKFDPEVRKRIGLVADHLNANYKVPRGKGPAIFKKVAKALRAEGIAYSRKLWRSDLGQLRRSFLFLSAKDRKTRLEAKRKAAFKQAITCLERDRIYSWKALNEAEIADIKALAIPKTILRKAGLSVTAEDRGSEDREREGKGSFEDEKRFIAGLAAELVSRVEAILEHDKILHRKNEEARDLRRTVRINEEHISFLEDEISHLERRFATYRKDTLKKLLAVQAEKLEDLAQKFPELELGRIVEEVKQREQDTQTEIEGLANKLPARFRWDGTTGKINYGDQFFSELLLLTPEKRARCLHLLNTFASRGPFYGTLRTNKAVLRLLFSPAGCFVSGSRSGVYFTWKKENGNGKGGRDKAEFASLRKSCMSGLGDVFVYWLFQEGDRRVGNQLIV